MKIAVAGGTGLLGRQVVAAAEQQGHDALVLARSRGVDLVTGSGLADALVDVEVAQKLLQLATGEPTRAITEFAGPREESLVEMVRAYASARGSKAWIPAVSIPGAFGRAQRDGSLLPGPDAERGVQTFAEWLRGL